MFGYVFKIKIDHKKLTKKLNEQVNTLTNIMYSDISNQNRAISPQTYNNSCKNNSPPSKKPDPKNQFLLTIQESHESNTSSSKDTRSGTPIQPPPQSVLNSNLTTPYNNLDEIIKVVDDDLGEKKLKFFYVPFKKKADPHEPNTSTPKEIINSKHSFRNAQYEISIQPPKIENKLSAFRKKTKQLFQKQLQNLMSDENQDPSAGRNSFFTSRMQNFELNRTVNVDLESALLDKTFDCENTTFFQNPNYSPNNKF